MANHTTLGYISVVVAVVLFGSFGTLIKSHGVQSRNVNPMVIQAYFAISITATSMITLAWESWEFTWYGALGGFLWTNCSIFSFISINLAGLGKAQGVWSGASIVVSFFIGTVFFKEPLQSVGYSVVAIVLMLIGVAGIASTPTVDSDEDDAHDSSSSSTKSSSSPSANKSNSEEVLLRDADHVAMDVPPSAFDIDTVTSTKNSKTRVAWGIFTSCMTGLFNGSIMVPFAFNSVKSIVYIISFAFGVCITTAVSLVAIALKTGKFPKFYIGTEVPMRALLAGVIWNVGNGASIYATRYLGQAVGFSLTQLALLVSGFWGVLFFKEITGAKHVGQFAIASLILVAGAVILGVLGKGGD